MATNDVVMGEKDLNFSHAICSICDNGGDLICCEGRCLRSFHATVEDGIDTACESLELSPKIIKEGTFLCENCQYNQHQCHVCGKLGSSDRSTGAEVFQCGDCACGYFYHPSCVANALRFKFGDVAKDIETEIASGNKFTCPLHYCHACKQKEQQDEPSVVMQFAVCSRCPIAYHRKCLPRDIAFENDDDEGILRRAWDDLIPNKILIYCMHHVINEDLQTPPRDHLKFPYTNLFKENRGKESVRDSLSKRTPSKSRKRFSRLYSVREPKKCLASKSRLPESSPTSYMNSSGIYPFRDRRMVSKYSMAPLLSGVKKKICKDENDSSTDRSNDSQKRRKSSTEVEEHSEMSGVEKQRECAEKEVTPGGNDSLVSSKLKNQQSSSLEKKTKSSDDIAAVCENDSLATILKNRHLKQSKISKEDVAAVSGNEKKMKSSKNGHSFGSFKKRREIIEEAAPVPIVFGLCAQGSEIFERLRDGKDSTTARNLENHAIPRSEKIVRSSKEIDSFGSEKERKSSENRTSVGSSEKQSKIIKEVAAVSVASKMQIPKVCGSEKRSESTVEVTSSKDSVRMKLKNPIACGSENRSAVKVAGSEDSVPKKSENSKACSSGKQSEAVEKPADGIDRKRDNPSARGPLKRVESAERLAVCKVYMPRKLDNPSARGLEKRVESAEKLTGSKDSVSTKLKNPKSRGSEKMLERDGKLANRSKKPEGSGSEKRKSSENQLHSVGSLEKKSKIIKEAAVAVSCANKLMKPTSVSVEKVASISKEAEAEAAPTAPTAVVEKQVVDKVESSSRKDGEEEKNSSRTTTSTAIGNQSCSRSIMETPSNGAANGSGPVLKAPYKALDFYKGPYSPPTENNSVGWLIE